jgi:serine/threonine protein kinase/Tol biopolymer transport system component
MIPIGTRLGRYEVRSKIGEGGMGEVYLAQDTELDRPVALKFLSPEVAADQKRLNRFFQEAKAASALNHPNILTVYEIGRADDTNFFATEFVDGVTLRQRMKASMKLSDVLDIATQIASALVAAHTAGIVHRDIKPENLMVRRDGIVKVLDFGLAKLTDKQSLSAGSEVATRALVNTDPGSVMGTVAYMSPEQAAGREVDARSDIWSLGVVLYEMITGHVPFEGSTPSHIIVAITDREPLPVNHFAPDAPEALEWIVAEALTKDREERCQTAREMLGKLRRLKQRIESGATPTSISDLDRSVAPQSSLEPAMAATSLDAEQATAEAMGMSTARSGDLSVPPAVSSAEYVAVGIQRHKGVFIAALVIGLVVLIGIGFGLYKLLTQPKQLGQAKMTMLTTGGKVNGEDINGEVSISPDGKYVVCAAQDAAQQSSLWVRQISTNSLVRIIPPEKGGYLGTTFSRDGELIYYVAVLEKNKFEPTLYRIPVLGGNSVKVLDRVFGPITFSPDGKQFAFVRDNQEDMTLMVANTDGSGQPKSIAVRKQPDQFSTNGPSWSPDGKRIACGVVSATGAGYSTVVEVLVEGGTPKPIGSEKWAFVNRVIWMADGSGLIMTAQPEFSSVGTQVWFLPYPSGQARRITNDLNGYGGVSLGLTADSSTIATIQSLTASSIWVTAPNEDESHARQILKSSLPDSVSWTPDGRIVYPSRTGENWDIWIVNRDGSENKQLTADAFIDQGSSVSPDGRYIVFQSNRAGSWNIWRMDRDGGNPKQLTEGSYVDASAVCSPDGRFVVFMSVRSGKWTIWKVGIEGGPPVQLTAHLSQNPSISPDGKLIAYFYVDAQANDQIKLSIIPFEGGEPIKTIDLSRTSNPFSGFAWMPDGQAITYIDGGGGIQNVWSQPTDGSAPKQLTNFKSEFIASFAFSRDGKQIAVNRVTSTNEIVLIKGFQ